MTKKQKKSLIRLGVGVAFLLFAILFPVDSFAAEPISTWIKLALYMIPYLIIGGDVLLRAVRNIFHGEIFDENFLMCVATVGAFALSQFEEAVAVMLFYQIGEFFQSYAVNRSRQSIAAMMDIRPDFANVEIDGKLTQVDPDEVEVGTIIIVKPGERVPIDGVVTDGASQLDTAALTGESVPRSVKIGDDVISGTVNMSGVLSIKTTKAFGESTVSRILELVENASEKKAKSENFITKFARYYTPAVVGIAAILAVIPPLLFGGVWADWIERALIFLVVSCPCALVISVPLSFFGGIGGASKCGILVKGSNYLEALAEVKTIVFDKTGTLTNGTFEVVEIAPVGITKEQLIDLAACAESMSTHPIALSIKRADKGEVDSSRISDIKEIAGHGISAVVDGKSILAGNAKMMQDNGIAFTPYSDAGTVVYIAADGKFSGYIVISDTIKGDAKDAISQLKALGIEKTVMLTGDREATAQDVAKKLGLDAYHAELLPDDKVSMVEKLLAEKAAGTNLAFVGDGINDAPVLTRADVGIAMGAMGSDAAIEAADVVLMNDNPSDIALAIKAARKTLRIVHQNIVFALGIKLLVLILAAFGDATMWEAVFADVGVSFIAILNAMRCLKVK
ncbi:MAG: cadmium-translocating P-type ATPase [Clostridia bacterium]|nr:cadmium-translocating P-type ATPase [Clostridia bacterium]NLS85415.1 cadmium-translocating P-type ATPase [Oscillospiraceae bacterium]